jgi:hypothetical protein
MGFRDLQLFNKVLLACQGLRLLHQPSPLLCRVHKAMYFPNQSFLEAAVSAMLPKYGGAFVNLRRSCLMA